MARTDAIRSPRSSNRAVVHRERHRVPLAQRNHLRPRLHTRPLLGEYEFAAGEISLRFRKQDRDLYREDVLSIKILMQAVEVALAIVEEQRRRPLLPRIVASPEKILVIFRVADLDPHGAVPAIRDRRKPPVERYAETLNQVGQWVAEVFVLAAPEAVPCHDHAAPEYGLPRIQGSERLAFTGREDALEQSASLLVQIPPDLLPIERIDARDRLINGD